MKTVTLTELRRNLESYLDDAAKNGDIIITKYGKQVARITAATNAEGVVQPVVVNGAVNGTNGAAETAAA